MNITGEDVGVGRLMELEIIGLGHEITTTRYSESTPEEVKSNNKRYDDEHGVNIYHMRTKRNRWPCKEQTG